MDKVLLYEELSLNALPALQTQFYDGWVLRFTSGYGYTSRANSVNILYPSTIDITEKVSECEKRYFNQELPAIFKITDGLDIQFDSFLDGLGYKVSSPTYLMTSNLSDFQYRAAASDCFLSTSINDDWLDAYFRLSKYIENKKISIATQVFSNIKVDLICGQIIKNDETVACGLCVVERGYAGLFNVIVDEEYRGKGYGSEICESLLSAARQSGACTAYLQVIHENHIAISLYKKLGFESEYSYWYRVKNKTAAKI